MPDPTQHVRVALSAADLERCHAHGLERAEVERQLALLRSPPAPLRLARPCRPGDGIQLLGTEEKAAALAAHQEEASAGRFLCFVPASGAASRMFKSLFAARALQGDRSALAHLAESGDREAREAVTILAALPRYAFYDELLHALPRGLRGASLERDLSTLLDAILTSSGLDLSSLPKGLLPFHRYPDHARSAFEEHLVEASAIARDRAGRVRLHLTISPEHRSRFIAHLAEARARVEKRLGVQLEVSFSTQKPSTDTLALDADGLPARDADGELLFRPGGHGALLENLNDLGGDLVYVKNIDNVVPDHLRDPVVEWRRLLGGCLALLQARIFALLDSLDESQAKADALGRALAFIAHELGTPIPSGVARGSAAERERFLRAHLERPIRVCGMVRSEGDPGGAPFWVREPDGELSRQIVETAQVDRGEEEQRAIHARATHFNPADMALALRDHRGRPFDLTRFVDRQAVFIAEKSSGGRALRALEHPGLWNGAMAHWITAFIEAPAEVFHPVKSLADLLGSAHQPPAA